MNGSDALERITSPNFMLFELLFSWIPLIVFFILFLAILYFVIKHLNFNRNMQINVDKSYYFRDIPCFKNINVVYFLLYNFSDYKKEMLNNGLIGAYLLDWYKKGYIAITSKEQNNYIIDLKNGEWDKNTLEDHLYNLLKKVAGNNNLLEKNEIKNYCSIDANYVQFKTFFNSVLDYAQSLLRQNNYITVAPSKDYFFFKTPPKYTLSETLKTEYKNLIGLKQFLENMSLIDEKKVIEVNMWEEYLIYANLLGIADKIKMQFKKIYPNYNILDSIFAPQFDNSFYGPLKSLYKQVKVQTIVMIASSIVILLIILFGKSIAYLFAFLVIILTLYFIYRFTLGKYIINKKVKEMNETILAKITYVETYKDTEYDSDLNKQITVVHHYIKYQYGINGITYTGSGIYDKFAFAPKVGQSVKIYYNEHHPENSELQQEHNEGLIIFIIVLTIFLLPVLLRIFINN